MEEDQGASTQGISVIDCHDFVDSDGGSRRATRSSVVSQFAPPLLTRVSPPPIRFCILGDMDENTTALERAFQLARSGKCVSVNDIRVTLAAEGYPRDQLTGPSLTKQLKELIRSSQELRRAPVR